MKDKFVTWEATPNDIGIEKQNEYLYVTKYKDGDFGFEVTDKNEDTVWVCFSKESVVQMAKKILELAEAQND